VPHWPVTQPRVFCLDVYKPFSLFPPVLIDVSYRAIDISDSTSIGELKMPKAAQRTPRRSFSDDFKQKALDRVRAGESVSSVAKELGIVPNLLYLWKSNFASGAIEPESSLERPSGSVSESKDLVRENELLKLEIDYLRRRESILKRK
jgi:transposase-like protein